jgi:hypothetical protein
MQWPTEKDSKHLFLLAIALSVHWLLITSLTSFSVGHCIVCPLVSDYLFDIFICWPLHCLSIGFWLPLWHLYLLAIALSVHWLLITSLTSLSVGHCIVCPLVFDYPFDIFICWPLHCSEANGQTMQWPTDKDVKEVIRNQWTDNAMAKR